MRILHSAVSLNPSVGVVNQMQWELESAKLLNIPYDVVIYCQKKSVISMEVARFDEEIIYKKGSFFSQIRRWYLLRRNYYLWLKSQEKNYDIFILRYSAYDPLQWYFVRKISKPIFFMHHTLELPELASKKSFQFMVSYALEFFLGKSTLKKCTGIIGVTNEIIQHELLRVKNRVKKFFLYPNGIILKKIELVDNRQQIPELLFVANKFSRWHGLDLLLMDIQKKPSMLFVLHLVGEVSSEDLSLINDDPRIIVHGIKTHSEITELSKKCWLGLSSFALFRQGMKDACTLKVREYFMNGLPVYAGYHDVFPENFKYFNFGEANIENILIYANQIRGFSRIEVFEAVKNYIDKVVLLKKFYTELNSFFSEKTSFLERDK